MYLGGKAVQLTGQQVFKLGRQLFERLPSLSPSFIKRVLRREMIVSPARELGAIENLHPPLLTFKGGRYTEGVAHASRPLVDAPILLRGTQQNAGFVPLEVAKMLEGQTFKNFDSFRSAFWKAVAKSKYAGEFGSININRMIKGKAPLVHESQQLGKRVVYEIHHGTPITRGGATYDLSNLMIISPRQHLEILEKAIHFGK